MFVYLIKEDSKLDRDALKNNKKLQNLIQLRVKYKISLLILLTQSNIYCTKIKRDDKDWKKNWKIAIETNKTTLLNDINEIIKKENNSNFLLEESNILHFVLVEPRQKPKTDKEKFDLLPDEIKEKYRDYDEEKKKFAIDNFLDGWESSEKEVYDFIKVQINEKVLLGQKELIEIFREKLPSQYHNALTLID